MGVRVDDVESGHCGDLKKRREKQEDSRGRMRRWRRRRGEDPMR